jgi:ribosomal protein L37E
MDAAAHESSGGGGGGGNMRANVALGIRLSSRWAPPKNTSTMFRLLPGCYENLNGMEMEYYSYVEHFAARSNRGFICSKEYRIENGRLVTIGGKCLGCEARDGGAADIGWSMKHVFNGIHLAWYHLEPVVDRAGAKVFYTKGERKGEPVYNKVPCEGRKCKYCTEGLQKIFGKKVYWSMGTGHRNALVGYGRDIERRCQCGGKLVDVAHLCSECGFAVVDMSTTQLTDAEIEEKKFSKVKCSECGTEDYLLRHTDCSGCKDPKPLSIFDCDLEIRRQGEGTNSTIQIPDWQFKPLDKELEPLAKPWPFKQIFAPDSFEWQAKALKIANPYADEKVDEHARDYDKPEDVDPDFEP